MTHLQCKNEIPGYRFSNGSSGKKWVRGRTMFSTGKQYTGNGPEYKAHIIKTNLDTGEMEIASLKEHKKFLTDECYEKYLLERFESLTKN